ncbi:calcium-activated potassium channel subunit beta-1 isoform X2 [Myotis daubentonii]|uniref:calcium-activated potassium channel subunit beta-1 isoform X2 n=1 Tax=Myotis daubentonii TaxID=98922 RepID=UPI002873BC4C|nr:calcium-activated potassium channel subunit beta-1 isoform X2 [Myotis daubentonii]
MGKKLVMAQKRGETRALCLGVAMVVCAVIAYYILCTTMLPLCQKSVWTQESTCHLIETNIRDQEELEGRKVAQYPCLWVNVSAVGRWAVLYHTEDTWDQNQQSFPAEPHLTRPEAPQNKSVSELNVCHARVHNAPLDAPFLPSAFQRLILAGQHLLPGSHRARPQRVFNVNYCQYLQNVRVHIKLWFSDFS